MAKFRGPWKSLLLVLVGLVLSFQYGDSDTNPTSSTIIQTSSQGKVSGNPTVTGISSADSPPRTSSTQTASDNLPNPTPNLPISASPARTSSNTTPESKATLSPTNSITTTTTTTKQESKATLSPPHNITTTTIKQDDTTALPAVTPAQQHTHATQNTTKTESQVTSHSARTLSPALSNASTTQQALYTATPPITPTQQHTHLTPTVPENSSAITSTTATTPALIPNQTSEKPHTCNYNLQIEEKQLTVKINSSDPTANYTFTFKSDVNITKTLLNGSHSIEFKLFKPCQNYSVDVKPTCAPISDQDKSFRTRDLLDKDVHLRLNTTDPKVTVCFETIWNLKNCFPITARNSCKNQSARFNGNKCSNIKLHDFNLPPEKPEIDFEKKFPTSLYWVNNSSHCTKNLIYTCKDSKSKVTVDVKDLKPFTNYTCQGTYYHKEGNISSEKTVYINCEVNEPTISVNSTNLNVSWNFTSNNCTNFYFAGVTMETNCNITGTSRCNSRTCNFPGLRPWTNYSCQIAAIYNNNTFKSVQKFFTSSSANPQTPPIQTRMLSHNSFEVTCNVKIWNGIVGNYRAEIHPDGTVQNTSPNTCHFIFKDLHYLTTYTVKIIATNGNGNKSESVKDISTSYNDKAILGILGFLIVITTVALLFVLHKIYLLKREKSRNEQEMDDLLPTNTLIPVEPMSPDSLLEAYKKKRADEGRLFMEEFQSVPRIFSNFAVREAKKPENQSKNRYIDILPYDYNRVTLSHGETSDYINASFIEGYKETNKYIAAQGPKEESMVDFWTMIWEQKTSIIVMVTRCEEGNKNKCAQYWPSMERETEIFDDLVVKIRAEENCPNYIIRHLTLMNRKEKSTEREITHIQFTSWPDHGVPSDPGLLLKLRRRVNSFKNFFSGPIVIHCSAGVGRTGTYIGIDAMIESLEAEGRVDIYGYVVKLRRQRCLMVQVEAQYVLIHTALIEYSQFGETEISLSNYHSEVNTLRQKEGNESLMEMEFLKLPRFKNYRASSTARTEENKKKNRSSVVPYDFNRVAIKVEDEASHESDADDDEDYSTDEEDEALTKYINASYLDGYWSPNSLIVAQGPMEDTVGDFLHMLYQKKVKSVFMLSECTENDQEFCSQYWGDEKKTFEGMTVEVKETENFPTYVRRCLEIQHTKRKDSHTLQQYHFLKWTGLELPANTLELIDMMKSIRQSSDGSKAENLPIVAHCNDGSSRSGIFCALWKLLDSADTEKLVDVFQTVKDLRKARLGMINTLVQYEFLYTALEAAYPVQNGEVKKPSQAPADSVQVVDESTALIAPSKDTVATESTQESTDPTPPAEGAVEAKPEPEKALSENAANGPTTTVEV